MAAFREHVTVSSLLGVTYGAGAALAFGFPATPACLAGWLTAVSGMLPDLDLDTGRPAKEVFGLLGAVAPLMLIHPLLTWTGWSGDAETVMLLLVLLYLALRYGLAYFVGRLSIHRGMFHSIPAMFIAAELAFLGYPSASMRTKLLMAGGVAAGFFSHLVLDEIYSVEFDGIQPRLKRSSGTAIKMFGDSLFPNVLTFSLLATLTLATLSTAGLLRDDLTQARARAENNVPTPTRTFEERDDRRPRRVDRFAPDRNDVDLRRNDVNSYRSDLGPARNESEFPTNRAQPAESYRDRPRRSSTELPESNGMRLQ